MPLPARNPRTDLPPKVKRTRPGDSKTHLAFVRSLPCCVCYPVASSYGIQAHHLMRAVDNRPKGTSLKREDRWAIPLCAFHHLRDFGGKESVHGHGDDEALLAQHGIDGRALAARLWTITTTKDPEERYELGLRAVQRAKQVERVASASGNET